MHLSNITNNPRHFLNYKPGEGFLHTKEILEQIRRNVNEKIRKFEGPEQIPSLCPVLFFMADPTTGCLHNLSEITYKDWVLAPALNEILHNLYHELSNLEDNKINNYLIELKTFKDSTWGDWLTFKRDECITNSMEENFLRYTFDDITVENKWRIKKLKDLLNKIENIIKDLSAEGTSHIEQAWSIFNARQMRMAAYKKIVALLQEELPNYENLNKKLKEGIKTHPKFSFTNHNDKPLTNWIALNKKLTNKAKGKDIIASIICVFQELAQEIETSKAFNLLREKAIKKYMTRYDSDCIEFEDLVFYSNKFNPWSKRKITKKEKREKYPKYYVLDHFEKFFYGATDRVENIVYMPIRSFPYSGLILGQAVSINIGTPNISAHAQALKMYEGRISHASLSDIYNSVTDAVISAVKPDLPNIICKNLIKLVSAKAVIAIHRKKQCKVLSKNLQLKEGAGIIDMKKFAKDIGKATKTADSNSIYWQLLDEEILLKEFECDLSFLKDDGLDINGEKFISLLLVSIGCQCLKLSADQSNYCFVMIFDRPSSVIELAAPEIALLITNLLETGSRRHETFERESSMVVYTDKFRKLEGHINNALQNCDAILKSKANSNAKNSCHNLHRQFSKLRYWITTKKQRPDFDDLLRAIDQFNKANVEESANDIIGLITKIKPILSEQKNESTKE